MRKATTLTGVAIGFMILVCTLAIALLSYSLGATRGTEFGYQEGLRVADAWEQRARRCEENQR